MIKKIYDTEIKYYNCFCDSIVLENCIRFFDNRIMDMYSHNFTYIKDDVSNLNLIKIIKKEIENRKQNGHKFLRVVTSANLNKEILNELSIKYDIEEYNYYGTSTDQYKHLKIRPDTEVLKADNTIVAEHGRFVDVCANYEAMTLEFAIRRINRKYEVYDDPSKELDLYVCYNGSEPVGNCELLLNETIAKIEDFDVLEIYQRKGYGTFTIRSLLKNCSDMGIGEAYLVTDKEDTAKEMYLKCGMNLVGRRYEIMFHL